CGNNALPDLKLTIDRVRANGWKRRSLVVAARSGEGPLAIPICRPSSSCMAKTVFVEATRSRPGKPPEGNLGLEARVTLVAAGFGLQIDDPGLPDWWDMLKPETSVGLIANSPGCVSLPSTARSPASPRKACAITCAGAAGRVAHP